jgi:hypothetical protein
LGASEVLADLSSAVVFVFADPPGEPVVAERIAPLPPKQEGGHAHVSLPVGERLTLGYVARRGKGRLLVLGVAPDPELLLAVHAWSGARIACRAGTGQRIQSALFRRGDEYFVVVTNTASHPQDTLLRLDVPARLTAARDLRSGLETRVTSDSVTVRVPARSGTVVRLS